MGAAVWAPGHLLSRLSAGCLGAMLCDWHVIEIYLHIVRVKVVIVSKLANAILLSL